MADTPEGRVKKEGRRICTELGMDHYPTNQGGMSVAGRPDDEGCLYGMSVSIEYKAEMIWKRTKSAFKTIPTLQQCKRMEERRKAGGITLVVDKHNLDMLARDLSYIKQRALSLSPLELSVECEFVLACIWTFPTTQYAQWLNLETGECPFLVRDPGKNPSGIV